MVWKEIIDHGKILCAENVAVSFVSSEEVRIDMDLYT